MERLHSTQSGHCGLADLLRGVYPKHSAYFQRGAGRRQKVPPILVERNGLIKKNPRNAGGRVRRHEHPRIVDWSAQSASGLVDSIQLEATNGHFLSMPVYIHLTVAGLSL